MRSRALFVPLFLLTISISTAACGDDSPSAWVSKSDNQPAAGAPSPAAPPAAADAPEPPAADGAAPPAADGPGPGTAAKPKEPKKTPARPKKTATVRPARPALPAGRVPDFLVGEWIGGPGSESGRYLVITDSGRYERGRVGGGVESSGVVVADEDAATFHDRDGGKERANLTYTDAAGIVVLSVNYAELGYYSYVLD
jgi:hypothetical protein